MNNFSYNGSLGSEPEDSQEMYRLWCEKEWWSNREAICVFLKINPDYASPDNVFESLIRSEPNRHIVKLVNMAVRAGLIKNLVIETAVWSCRAPCKDWLEWALTKFSIKLDDELLLAAGIDISKHYARNKGSFRPDNEKIIKAKFITAAKITLFLVSKPRLKDILQLLENSDPTQHFPEDKTLRKWLKEAGIELFSTKQTNEEIEKIENKLIPLTRIKQ